jgi:hypothetical protein
VGTRSPSLWEETGGAAITLPGSGVTQERNYADSAHCAEIARQSAHDCAPGGATTMSARQPAGARTMPFVERIALAQAERAHCWANWHWQHHGGQMCAAANGRTLRCTCSTETQRCLLGPKAQRGVHEQAASQGHSLRRLLEKYSLGCVGPPCRCVRRCVGLPC